MASKISGTSFWNELEKVVIDKKDNTYILSIFGNNFGPNKDTVWFDDMQIRDNNILSWDDSRIDASLGTIDIIDGVFPFHTPVHRGFRYSNRYIL